ncbi:hypothetical protein [Thalassomonas sp. RHCl1]|uniref:hypothetical protein n=1 Tax=Thalassomonas sp. RHCl1 TaxID=2995320 RepID=UPI00248AF2D2|nr:hypothetical protein [Thalassomonas sp. RHCl1]
MAAFFGPFFTQASIFTDGTVPVQAPTMIYGVNVDCLTPYGEKLGSVFMEGQPSEDAQYQACHGIFVSYVNSLAIAYGCKVTSASWSDVRTYKRTHQTGLYCDMGTTTSIHLLGKASEVIEKTYCPPEELPSFTYSIKNAEGDTTSCADPNAIPMFDTCPAPSSAILPAGSNTADEMCYSLADGSVCSVSRRSSGTYTFSEGNCYAVPQDNFELPTGQDDGQGCTDYGSAKACVTDPADVCSTGPTIDGSAYYTCAAGCGDYNGEFVCFDDDSAAQEETDPFEQDNPDSNDDGVVDTSDTNRILGKLQSLTNDGNASLRQMKSSLDGIKTNTDIISSFGQGLSEISKGIGEANAKLEEQKEKETYTTTLTTPDKTLYNGLFDDAHIAEVKAKVEEKKEEMKAYIVQVRGEAAAILSVTVPNAADYQDRTLTLTQGSFDLSLNRFSDFFKLLAGPIMLVCSILAAFILLGGKDR